MSDKIHPADDAVSKRTVTEVLAMLGVDADQPEAVEEFRQDRAFVKKLRKVTNIVFLGFFVAAMSAIGISIGIRVAFWFGVGH